MVGTKVPAKAHTVREVPTDPPTNPTPGFLQLARPAGPQLQAREEGPGKQEFLPPTGGRAALSPYPALPGGGGTQVRALFLPASPPHRLGEQQSNGREKVWPGPALGGPQSIYPVITVCGTENRAGKNKTNLPP